MQIKTAIIILTLMVGAGAAAAQGHADSLSAAGLIERGQNAERLGLTELAERYYRRALQAPEGDATGLAQQRLGILLEQKEYYPEAIGLLNQSNTAEALAHQAYCLLQIHQIDSAAHCAARAIERDTASALAMTMMAYVETERDHHINAIAWANRALKANPKSAQGENVMGYIQFRKGNHTEAMRHFKKAIQMDSTMANAYYNLGTLYCMRNSQDMAIKLLKQGLRRNPRNIRLFTALAYAYRMRGDAYKYIGKAYTEWGKYDKAIQSFIRSTNISTTDPETYMYLAELYGKQKKGERKQQSAYKKAARLGEKEAQAWLVKRGIAW